MKINTMTQGNYTIATVTDGKNTAIGIAKYNPNDAAMVKRDKKGKKIKNRQGQTIPLHPISEKFGQMVAIGRAKKNWEKGIFVDVVTQEAEVAEEPVTDKFFKALDKTLDLVSAAAG